MRFKDKVVLVTGAGVGIGRAACLAFAKEGANVAVNSLTPKNGEETLALLKAAGGKGVYLQGDVSSPVDAQRIVDETVRAFGRIDILINNAGIVIGGRADDTELDDFEKMMAVNVRGVFLVTRAAIGYMQKSGGGVIVNNASVVAQKGLKNRFGYTASKGAVLAMTRAIAADHVEEGIRCNCVCPGTILTPSLEQRIASTPPDPVTARAAFVARQPMGRLGTPEEIAQAFLFAADESAGFMTGGIISMDGGMTM